MRYYKPLLSLVSFLCLMVCCNNNNDRHKNGTDTTTVLQAESPRYDSLDSIAQTKAFARAMSYAKEHRNDSQFTYQKQIGPTLEDSFGVSLRLDFGQLFTKGKKHLLIRRQTPGTVMIDIMLLENDSFRLICKTENEAQNYVGDTIRDVNGDGYKDYLLHLYAASGCCRRNFYDTHLYLAHADSLTEGYEFMNPTFSAREKVIRGVQYGHPGEVPLYKYKWNGLRVDTLEFVRPDTANKGQFLITRSDDWPLSPKDIKRSVKSLPPEYQHIEDIDWFLSYLKE
ncbi:MAG TPA: hypothetical protein VGE90_17770 [Chitinophaga sp.]